MGNEKIFCLTMLLGVMVSGCVSQGIFPNTAPLEEIELSGKGKGAGKSKANPVIAKIKQQQQLQQPPQQPPEPARTAGEEAGAGDEREEAAARGNHRALGCQG